MLPYDKMLVPKKALTQLNPFPFLDKIADQPLFRLYTCPQTQLCKPLWDSLQKFMHCICV